MKNNPATKKNDTVKKPTTPQLLFCAVCLVITSALQGCTSQENDSVEISEHLPTEHPPITLIEPKQRPHKTFPLWAIQHSESEDLGYLFNDKSTTPHQKQWAILTQSIRNAAKIGTKKRIPKLLVKNRTFSTEGPEDAIRVNYDDINLLKVLNMEPVTQNAPEMMPHWLQKLNGKRIRIRGFMSPPYKMTQLQRFLMGRDNEACCYPGRAKIYDLFPVKMRDGVTTRYILNRPFDVVGIFEIDPWYEDKEWLGLYRITDAVIIQ